MAISDDSPPTHHSHLFTVRLWLEVLDEQQVEVRGQVQHVLSGETRYFREWTALITFLTTMFASLEGQTVLWFIQTDSTSQGETYKS